MPKGHYARGSRPVSSGPSSHSATAVAVRAACWREPIDDRAARTPASDGSSMRQLPPSAGALTQMPGPPSDPRRDAPLKPPRSAHNHGHAHEASAGEVLAAAIDADDRELVGPRLRTNRTRRTTRLGSRVGEAMNLERYLTPDLRELTSGHDPAAGSCSEADPRAIPAAQRSAFARRTPASPGTAATSRRHGARLTQPLARGSPTPISPC